MKKIVSLLLALLMLVSSASALAAVTDPLANEPGVSPIVKEPGSVTLSLGIRQNVNVTSYEDNYMTNWLKENTGLNFEFVLFPVTDYQQKLDLLVSSGSKLPDIIGFGMDDPIRRYNYGVNGAIIPLNDLYDNLGQTYFDFCANMGQDGAKILKEITSADGNIYAIPYKDNNYANYYSQRAFINQTWMEKLGLDMPTTSEELVEVLKAFRDSDPNGNGEADEIPMMGCDVGWQSKALGYLQNMFIYFDDAANEMFYLPLSDTDGKLDVSYDKEDYRDFLIYANMLVKEGLLSPLSFTQDNAQYSALKRSDPAVIGICVTGGAVDLYFGNQKDKYVPFEVMKGPKGVQYQTANLNYSRGNSAITADCEHPEIAFLFLSYNTYNEDTFKEFYINRWGEQDVDWRFAKEGEIGVFDMVGYPANLFQLNSTWGQLTNKHWQGGVPFTNIVNPMTLIEVFGGDPDNDEYQYAVNYSINRVHAPSFDDLVGPLPYTADEAEKYNDARTALKTYVKEARTLFAIGQLDPSSDADWNNYIAELEKLQYKELLEVDRATYDKMMSN